ncbi:response regulator [Paralcaligenes ureilyticus]|uniref:PAS domain S-box-containing protein n=1 Tax=Paralcaligenes ureilyticus TaxID=627131 RepID=A0A4R3MD19_9BURK|nr:response regulator [Paralcaligenes ureilyticus]TCT10149.1 PAS domain S-box-containing protein [Paralcaligenes ureilyticus]
MKVTESEILNASILIVDDQDANVALFEQMMRQGGYTCIASTMNPKEVCALHRANCYDLILLDLKMPGMDGFEVMEGLKENDTEDYLAVIVVTGQSDDKLRALQAGAKDFISKPFSLVEVRTRVRNILEVRLLYKKLDSYNKMLEQAVYERTAQLTESEARYRSLVELASDWYWEQDENGSFTKVSGPVLEILGMDARPAAEDLKSVALTVTAETADAASTLEGAPAGDAPTSWNEAQRQALQAKIEARQPFLDFVFSQVNADGSRRQFRVSGEPMFNRSCRFIGYRGIGVEIIAEK